jgi:hypothetical protein
MYGCNVRRTLKFTSVAVCNESCSSLRCTPAATLLCIAVLQDCSMEGLLNQRGVEIKCYHAQAGWCNISAVDMRSECTGVRILDHLSSFLAEDFCGFSLVRL